MKTNYEEVKYLVFDVETVPDVKLIRKVRYPQEELDDLQVVEKYREEIMDASNGSSEFIPVTFQYPVSITVGKVRGDFSLIDVVCLDDPDFNPHEMTRLFWLGVESLYSHASLVTFNGRGFDVPLLELMAYRYGISAKRHFKDKFAGRYRFGTKHIDLQDWITNYNAIRMNGGLNLLAKVIGKPGKMSTTGDKVYDLFLEGKIREINDYCIHDVLDTYFVFLRSRVMLGELSIEKEQEIVQNTKELIKTKSETVPAYKEYYDNWGDWEPWP